ncbi:hypothetical protein A2U01_0091218, partial [Trifolium medium]|nr:hypothetical protein [Trifolium medium]
PLTTGTKPRTISEFFTPLVGATLHTPVALTVATPTSNSKDFHSYLLPYSRFYRALTT